jgi:NTE family protein
LRAEIVVGKSAYSLQIARLIIEAADSVKQVTTLSEPDRITSCFNAGIPAFQLGGVTRFAAYGTNELLTNQYYLGQLGYIRTLKNLPPLLGSTIDFLGAFEVGKTYQLPHGPKPPNIPGDVVGALIVNTRFGPVEAGGAIGNYGHAKFFFQVGRIF